MKLYVLDNGRIENDLANLVNMNALATSQNKNSPAEWIDEPVYSVLIEHPDGLVLFDTAANPKAMTERWPEHNRLNTPYYAKEENYLPNVLGRLGHSTDDVKYVVASHLHEDHGGCLEMFKKSEIIAHEDEFTNMMKLYGLNRGMGAYIRADIEQWLKADLNWNLISPKDGDVELLEGLTILNFGPGHTFGMLGLLVELPRDGNIILASDTVFTTKNYGPPIVYPGVAYDTVGYVDTIRRIHRIAKEKNAQVWFGHDIQQFDTLVKSDEGCYE